MGVISIIIAALVALAPAPGGQKMFSQADFEQLRFLEGRWQGTAPDGSTFFEEYDFPEAHTMRSRRFPDAKFMGSTDGSTIALKDGVISSTWGEFTWAASAVSPGLVQFDPVNAPSAFSWRKVDADTVEVVQKWTDKDGKQQSYTVPLKRIAPQ